MAKLSELAKAIATLEAERDLLNRCLERLRDLQQAAVKPKRKPPRAVPLKAVEQ